MVTCPNCSARVPEDAGFCPKCGNYAGEHFENTYREMKREPGKSRHSYREGTRWSPRRGLINLIMLGLLVVYAGVIMYLATSGVTSLIGRNNAWAYLLAGLGTYLFIRIITGYQMKKR